MAERKTETRLSPSENEPTEHELQQMRNNAERVRRNLETEPTRPAHADGYVHMTGPTGDAVTFIPGERLPDWAAKQYQAGKTAAAPADRDEQIVRRGSE